MLVAPVQATPPPRGGRRRRSLRVGIPIAVLVLTVGAGLVGRLAEHDQDRPAPPAVAHPSPVADRAVEHSLREPGATIAPTDPAASTTFDVPTSAFRLPVRTVPDLVADLESEPPVGLLAVAGNLVVDPRLPPCDHPATVANSFCERVGTMTGTEQPRSATLGEDVPVPSVRQVAGISSIAVSVPAGVKLPIAVVFASAVEGAARPKPVVLLGRFGTSSGSRCGIRPSCVPALIVERIAWVAGGWSDDGIVRSSTIPPSASIAQGPAARTIALRETDRDEPVLGRALLTRDDLMRVDPVAERAIGRVVDGPIWYVRSVARPTVPGGPRRVTWTAIDAVTGHVLADGQS